MRFESQDRKAQSEFKLGLIRQRSLAPDSKASQETKVWLVHRLICDMVSHACNSSSEPHLESTRSRSIYCSSSLCP